ncbi:MAG: metal-sulfur cluster assembly factor [Gemmatimonadaceae bacterium]
MSEEPASTESATKDAGSGAVVSEEQVKLALRRVKDPDLHLNIVDLGLLYGIRVDGSTVNVDMTLTSPACPSGPEIVGSVEREVSAIDGVETVKTNIVWTPFWTPDRIEPRVRAYLGL